MTSKPAFLLALIVIAPLVLLGWGGLRLARHERAQAQQRTRDLLAERLREVDRRIAAHFDLLRRDLHRLTSLDRYPADHLRALAREDARVLQLFVIAPDGRLVHPDPMGPLSESERDFLAKAAQIVTDRELQRAGEREPAESRASTAQAAGEGPLFQLPARSEVSSGWFTWYWGRGPNLIYWQRRPTGHIVGAALDRARWMADLIAILPDTPFRDRESAALSRVRLIDSSLQTIYQWGDYQPPANAAPACQVPLSAPLSGWYVQQFVPQPMLTSGGTSVFLSFGFGLAGTAVGLAALAVYLYREYTRDMREAERRMSFVNRVSHELRTPLTNIRMYADLLDSDLEWLGDEASGVPKRRLKVIQAECQRLSRLISNVLTFARQQRESLSIQRMPCRVDDVVRSVVERFRPSLDQLGIAPEVESGAGRLVMADADAIEQILGNLINNVEKYAAQGRWLRIATDQQDGRTQITVSDRGPGIEAGSREKIFRPFWRGSERLHRAAGTGIGLSIARDLARLHGGDVTLLDQGCGAAFRVDLATQPCAREAES